MASMGKNFKRLSQRLEKSKTVLLGKLDLKKGSGIEDPKIKKGSNALLINGDTVKTAEDLYDVAGNCINETEKGLLNYTRNTMSNSLKHYVSLADETLKEAGVPSNKRKTVIKGIKDNVNKKYHRLSMGVKKSFSEFKKDISKWEHGEDSKEDKNDLKQVIKSGGETKKLENNSDIKDCLNTLQGDVPKKVDECEKEVLKNVKVMSNEFEKNLNNVLLEMAKKTNEIKNFNKKELEEMFESFETSLSKRLMTTCPKESKPDFRGTKDGLIIGGIKCASLTEIQRAASKELSRNIQITCNLYDVAAEMTQSLKNHLTEALQSEIRDSKYIKEIEKYIEDLFNGAITEFKVAADNYKDNVNRRINDGIKDLFGNKKELKKAKEDFEKFKVNGIDLEKYGKSEKFSTLEMILKNIYDFYKYSLTVNKIKQQCSIELEKIKQSVCKKYELK